jgi:hypothetical protein
MLLERRGNSRWLFHERKCARALLFRLLDPPFDVANRVEIFVEEEVVVDVAVFRRIAEPAAVVRAEPNVELSWDINSREG